MDNSVKFIRINPHISLITSDLNFICAQIGIIQGKKESLLIDAGASCAQINLLKEKIESKELNNNISKCIITHFHPDHIKNLEILNNLEVIGSKNTSRYTRVDTLINKNTTLDLGDISVEIIPLPSIHAKGSLCIYIPVYKIMFIGDSLCLRGENDNKRVTNKDITINMVNILKSHPTDLYIDGHKPFLNTSKVNEYLDFLLDKCKKSPSFNVEISKEEYDEDNLLDFFM